MQFLLVIFGWCAIITSLSIILVPYFLRRADLISGWTVFQVSCANFLGMASVQSGTATTHIYVNPMPDHYLRFVMGGIVFYVVSIVTYYYFRWPEKLGSRVLRKTGPRAPSVLMALLPVCMALSLGYLFVPQVQVLGQWLVMLGRGAGIIGLAFCLVIWSQRPFNITFGILFAMVLAFSAVAAAADFGRRDFLAVFMTVPICWYWLRARYYNPARVLMILSVFAVLAFAGVTGVSLARGLRANPGMSAVEFAMEKIRAIPQMLTKPNASQGVFGGDAVEASLASIWLYGSTKQHEPFFALKYILIHPIPRAWWPNKPVSIGVTLPKELGWSRAHRSDANIGPGVVGHGYHEGGLFFVAFYAWLFATVLRWFDSLLLRDPTSPYLLAAFAASSGQLVALTRGDIGLFSVIILGSWIAVMLLNYLARMFFWTDYLQTPQEAAQALAPEPQPYAWEDMPQSPTEAWRI